jgi:3-dehydroquinate synthetase
VDAAIGGQAAVNLAGAKNQVGLFHLPREVWIDPEVLGKLPTALKLEGLVEAYKTGLLFDPSLADLIASDLKALVDGDLLAITEVVYRSAAAKATLVAQDLREERGLRDVLNLGHTYGHAVESFNASSLSPARVSHGQAVALGLAVALEYSARHQGLDPQTTKEGVKLCKLLCGGNFPPAPSSREAERLLSFDKKIRAGRLRFVALKKPGKPIIEPEVKAEAVLEVANELLSREHNDE